MIRIGFVDDDVNHLQLMKSYLQKYGEQEKMDFSVSEFQNGLNFVEDYDGKLDVVFMDIEMPHLDGLEAARRIREADQSIGIIFVTNMAQYAIRGYEVNAIDFIVKPIGYYIFVDKLKRAIKFCERNTEKEIVIDTGDMVIRLKVSRITYIEKDKNKNYLVYHAKDDTYRVRGTIMAAEEALLNEGFSKCTSGCLVNLRHVTKVGKDTVWLDETELPLSRYQRKAFKEALMEHIGGM